MFAFGHYFSTYFLIKCLGSEEEKRLILLLSLTGILPDIDILLPIPHRTLTHHLYFFFPEIFFYNLILYALSRKTNLVLPILIHFMHIFSDALFGPVEILPGIKIAILNFASPAWDLIYGVFFLLLSYKIKSRYQALQV